LSSHKETMNKFGDLIRAKREEQEMLLRHLSAELDIDTAQMSKIERGEEATALWLADQVYAVVADEDVALKALIVAEKEVKYQKKVSK